MSAVKSFGKAAKSTLQTERLQWLEQLASLPEFLSPSAAKLIIQTAYASNGLMLCGCAVGERVP